MAAKLKVLIVESSYPKDFFGERLDGLSTHHLTKLLGIDSELLYALDKVHFKKAIQFGAKYDFDVLHLSCHGDKKGIALSDNTNIDWPEFTSIFSEKAFEPTALVMSSCCGAANALAEEFEKERRRPNIVFGSIDKRSYNEYALAWAILYSRFRTHSVSRDVAQDALKEIGAVVHPNFRYLRWAGHASGYKHFPAKGKRYAVTEMKIKGKFN